MSEARRTRDFEPTVRLKVLSERHAQLIRKQIEAFTEESRYLQSSRELQRERKAIMADASATALRLLLTAPNREARVIDLLGEMIRRQTSKLDRHMQYEIMCRVVEVCTRTWDELNPQRHSSAMAG